MVIWTSKKCRVLKQANHFGTSQKGIRAQQIGTEGVLTRQILTYALYYCNGRQYEVFLKSRLIVVANARALYSLVIHDVRVFNFACVFMEFIIIPSQTSG